jgi:hypothetical protein
MVFLSDAQIGQLLSIAKVVKTTNPKAKIQKKSERLNYPVEALEGGSLFELYTRQNQIDPDAYSCGLTYYPGSGDKGLTLVRYNGSNHIHYNPLEGEDRIVNKCHIHKATQRYMEAGDKCDKYAETTDRYSTMSEALACLLADCNISGLAIGAPEDDYPSQIGLFND